MEGPLSVLGGLSAAEFLAEYWQRKPLLVRQALPGAAGLISPDELAGLSLESDVESRLIRQEGDRWHMEKGPLAASRFETLPDSHWTLLVQAVDQQVPACAEILSRFDFLPQWRIDDLMISYAADQGSVGPHFDYYDVFLIQGSGSREWRLGQHCDEDTPLKPGQPLKLLTSFAESGRFLLQPGDMLYLPPGLAHWGVAQGECTTLSVGFRALSVPEFTDAFSDFVRHRIPEHSRFSDPGRPPQKSTALLANSDMAAIRRSMTALIEDDGFFRSFLGELLSAPKYATSIPDVDTAEGDGHIDVLYEPMEVLDLLDQGLPLRRHEGSRFVFTQRDHHADGFYINGREHLVPEGGEGLAVYLMNHRLPDGGHVRQLADEAAALRLLTDWLNLGVFYFESDDPDAS
jgi:50S ribosomal protein L16 3-hydroxylase